MKKNHHLVTSTLLLTALGASSFANAATLNVVGGQLIGASGVNVAGTLYDVEFKYGSCVDIFDGCDSNSDFDFTSISEANIAAQAVLDQVFIGQYDASNADVYGVGFSSENTEGRYVLRLPWEIGTNGVNNWFNARQILNYSDARIDQENAWLCCGDTPVDDTAGGGYLYQPIANNIMFADFTASAVPVPAAVWLFGSGLVGLVGVARRRRKA